MLPIKKYIDDIRSHIDPRLGFPNEELLDKMIYLSRFLNFISVKEL